MTNNNQYIWTLDKYDNYRELHCMHNIQLDYGTRSIRFRIQSMGFLYGYVLGDFNNYAKNSSSKLEWTANTSDGSLWLTKDLLYLDSMVEGSHDYYYILVDLNGNELRISSSGNVFSPLRFNWLINSNEIKIKSSCRFVTPGLTFDVVAITEDVDKYKKIVDVDWEILPQSPHIIKTDKGILVDRGIDKDIFNITVKCFYKNNPSISAEKKYSIIRENPNRGKLIHFFNKSGDYQGQDYAWELWCFDDNSEAQAVHFFAQSDFGTTAYCKLQNAIARKKVWNLNWHNDWADQTPSFKIDQNYDNHYLVHGDSTIYTSLNDVVKRTNPRIDYAIMDSADMIVASLSDTPMIGTSFELYINSVKIDSVNAIVKDQIRQVIFTNLPADIRGCDLIEIRANNTFMPIKVTMREYLNKFYYAEDDMGILFKDETISMRIWAPTAKKVELLLYTDCETDETAPCVFYDLKHECINGTYSTELAKEILENYFYLYKLHFDELNAQGEIYTKTTYAVDPYAVGLGVNGDKGTILNINNEDLMPEGWKTHSTPELINKEDSVIYEAHLRDFTISDESGIKENLQGKFLGACEGDSTYVDTETGNSVSTGIDSVKDLGATHIHFLPFFDFSSVDESNTNDKDNRNWGYDPKNYNAPDGSYSVEPENPNQRIIGLREMVLKFHQKDIRVVMDVVYNHMTDTVNFDKIVPGYYFRTDDSGSFTNGSGCGNELATERPMVSRFVLDSVIHWLTNYKLDGIRFDLMELIDLDTIKTIVKKVREIDPSIIIYGEPWKGGDSPLINSTYKGTQKGLDFSIFNDTFRDALRGNNNPGNGFINGDAHNSANVRRVIDGLRGDSDNFIDKPVETINYVDAHDNYTLWDHLEKSQNHNIVSGSFRKNIPENIFECRRIRRNALALGMILTAQGIPFIHGGAEFLRTKQGDHNSYKSNDDVNAFHWSSKLRFEPFFDFVKGLIEIRKNHPAFRMKERETIAKHLSINSAHNDKTSGVIISHFKDNANGDIWKDIVIIYNSTAIDGFDVNEIIPKSSTGTWYIVVNHSRAGVDSIENVVDGKLPLLRSHSMLMIHS